MNYKWMVVLFFILVISGLGVAGYSQFKDVLNPVISPTPLPSTQLFPASSSESDLKLTLGGNNSQFSPVSVEPAKIGVDKPTSQFSVTKNNKIIKQFKEFPGEYSKEELKDKGVVIETAKGKIVIGVYSENPKASSNILFLASQGFYDGLTFHRVESNFVIQGGDPLGNGTGGPGYIFKEDSMVKGNYARGTVAMAKRADEPSGSGGSQFFIMLSDNDLPQDYVIFGRVVEGMEVVDKIQIGDVMTKVGVYKLIYNASPSPSSK